MNALFDQSALATLAERLVAPPRPARPRAPRALSPRGGSQAGGAPRRPPGGPPRPEGDNMGLRAFLGRRQAVVSTNDLNGNVDELAERAVAMARIAPEDKFAGLAMPDQLATSIPDLDLLDAELPSVARLEATARAAE